jgi:hypothetical protein
LVPSDWEDSLVEMRDCRQSIDHQLEFVRLLVSENVAPDYERCVTRGECDEPFEAGSLFLKPQYRDADCKDLVQFTLSKREQRVSRPGTEGWRWQVVRADGNVELDAVAPNDTAPNDTATNDTAASCTSCHSQCDGSFDLRCAMDP